MVIISLVTMEVLPQDIIVVMLAMQLANLNNLHLVEDCMLQVDFELELHSY
jgi:hypothetical protein